MLRKFLLIGAMAAPLALGIQQSAFADLITRQASMTPINILGTDYNVFFNQDDDGRTTFIDVYDSLTPSLTFSDRSSAQSAVAAIIQSGVSFDEFAPAVSETNEIFAVPYFADPGVGRFWGSFSRGNASDFFGPGDLTAVRMGQGVSWGFVTFEEASSATPIPTPALLPGLLAMGFSAIRKRKSVESA